MTAMAEEETVEALSLVLQLWVGTGLSNEGYYCSTLQPLNFTFLLTAWAFFTHCFSKADKIRIIPLLFCKR